MTSTASTPTAAGPAATTSTTAIPSKAATLGASTPAVAAPAATTSTTAAELVVLPQYSVRRILATWAAAALPMAALAWIGAPLLAGRFDGPSAWQRALLLCL